MWANPLLCSALALTKHQELQGKLFFPLVSKSQTFSLVCRDLQVALAAQLSLHDSVLIPVLVTSLVCWVEVSNDVSWQREPGKSSMPWDNCPINPALVHFDKIYSISLDEKHFFLTLQCTKLPKSSSAFPGSSVADLPTHLQSMELLQTGSCPWGRTKDKRRLQKHICCWTLASVVPCWHDCCYMFIM